MKFLFKTSYDQDIRLFEDRAQALRYALNRTGLLGLPAAPIRAYVRTRAGLEAHLDSAGTAGWHEGHPPDARMIAAAAARGIDISGLRAREARPEDFSRFDLILAMDRDNLSELEGLRRGAGADLRLMLDFAPEAPVREVPDPYYGGAEGFERVLDLLEQAAAGLIAELRRR
jgi:protein-tyrosine phosphatase